VRQRTAAILWGGINYIISLDSKETVMLNFLIESLNSIAQIFNRYPRLHRRGTPAGIEIVAVSIFQKLEATNIFLNFIREMIPSLNLPFDSLRSLRTMVSRSTSLTVLRTVLSNVEAQPPR